MARPKNQTKRREDIMAAARRVITTRGLSALTRKDIADEAGVTAPSVSYYYPDLDELLLDVYERQIATFTIERPLAINNLKSTWDQLTAMINLSVADGPDDIDAIIMYQFSGEPRFSETYSRVSSKLHRHEEELFGSIFQAGIDAGIFNPDLDAKTLARALSALMDSYGLQVVGDEPGVNHSNACVEIEKIIASLLRYESDL